MQRAFEDRARRLFPERRVRREIQGVSLVVPWSHRLPDYVKLYPGYGQNLVALAKAVAVGESPARFSMIDVGANVGDSALQVLSAVDVDAVCVEGDQYWLPFLRENTANEKRIRIEHLMLLSSSEQEDGSFTAVRAHGTTRFAPGAAKGATPMGTPESLRRSLPTLAPFRLIKCDTDGFDVRLIPGLARAFSDTLPVLFFEFDPPLTRKTGDPRPERIWDELIALGYDRCAVWNNFGDILGCWPTRELPGIAHVLELPLETRGYHYWDIAATHRDDPHASAILRTLCP